MGAKKDRAVCRVLSNPHRPVSVESLSRHVDELSCRLHTAAFDVLGKHYIQTISVVQQEGDNVVIVVLTLAVSL